MDISTDGKLLACSNRDSGTVTIVDLEKREKLHEVPLGKHPEGISFLGSSHQLAAAVYADDRIVLVDADAGKVTRQIELFGKCGRGVIPRRPRPDVEGVAIIGDGTMEAARRLGYGAARDCMAGGDSGDRIECALGGGTLVAPYGSQRRPGLERRISQPDRLPAGSLMPANRPVAERSARAHWLDLCIL